MLKTFWHFSTLNIHINKYLSAFANKPYLEIKTCKFTNHRKNIGLYLQKFEFEQKWKKVKKIFKIYNGLSSIFIRKYLSVFANKNLIKKSNLKIDKPLQKT
jgi:hypothetical protein